jgi:type III secretion protein J
MRRFLVALPIALTLPLAACGSHVVVGGVDAAEARRCDVVLRAAGLDAVVERDESEGSGALRVVVHGDDADYRTALQVLVEHALPRRRAAGFSTEAASLIPSPGEERARYIKGLSGEIEALVESVDGVVSAEVLVSLPERRPLAQHPDPASASAIVTHLDASSPISADDVRTLVVRAIGAEIDPAHVAVVLKPAVRPTASHPVTRYERDRVVEAGFLVAVVALVALECATVWLLRARSARRGIVEGTNVR